MKKYLFSKGVVLFLLLLSIGCGQIKVGGKVTFSDGSPLSKGKVIFENDKSTFTANIREDGSFNMGILKDGQGIPAGKYNVAIAEAFDEDFPAADKPPIIKHLIAEKFRSTKTSGIEHDIKKNTRDISIVVEKP
jgi:hypothetical protein